MAAKHIFWTQVDIDRCTGTYYFGFGLTCIYGDFLSSRMTHLAPENSPLGIWPHRGGSGHVVTTLV